MARNKKQNRSYRKRTRYYDTPLQTVQRRYIQTINFGEQAASSKNLTKSPLSKFRKIRDRKVSKTPKNMRRGNIYITSKYLTPHKSYIQNLARSITRRAKERMNKVDSNVIDTTQAIRRRLSLLATPKNKVPKIKKKPKSATETILINDTLEEGEIVSFVDLSEESSDCVIVDDSDDCAELINCDNFSIANSILTPSDYNNAPKYNIIPTLQDISPVKILKKDLEPKPQPIIESQSEVEFISIIDTKAQNNKLFNKHEKKLNEKYNSNVYNATPANQRCEKKRLVLIDGSNVAFGHSLGHGRQQEFSVEGLKICIEYFQKLGHQVKAIVPQFRKNINKSTNPNALEQLNKVGLVLFTPCKNIPGHKSQTYDDRFILQLAVSLDAAIISNDNYRDLIDENEAFKKIIENRVVSYLWCEDCFIVSKDPYGRWGPTLDTILNRD